VLGDLLHDARGPGPAIVERVSAWRAAHPIEIDLVGGNHDRAAARVCEAWSIAPLGAEAMLGRIRLRHEPAWNGAADAASAPILAGHLHPMAQLARGARRVLLPCFRFAGGVGVLPAFTRFASGVRFEPATGQRLFAVAASRVLELPQPPR
jgi:metallophosphoesterase superfamily enzyme